MNCETEQNQRRIAQITIKNKHRNWIEMDKFWSEMSNFNTVKSERLGRQSVNLNRSELLLQSGSFLQIMLHYCEVIDLCCFSKCWVMLCDMFVRNELHIVHDAFWDFEGLRWGSELTWWISLLYSNLNWSRLSRLSDLLNIWLIIRWHCIVVLL
jgi:hypothetical protein